MAESTYVPEPETGEFFTQDLEQIKLNQDTEQIEKFPSQRVWEYRYRTYR